MSVVRIKAAALGAALLLGACSSGDEVTANDTVSATPQAGDPAALPAGDGPAAGAGIVTIESAHTVPDTVVRLKDAVARSGMMLVSATDASSAAQQYGQTLRPTSVVLIDAPRIDAALLGAQQTMALELPLRVVVYTDRAGQTWLSYDEIAWSAARHGVQGQEAALQKLAATLGSVVRAAAN